VADEEPTPASDEPGTDDVAAEPTAAPKGKPVEPAATLTRDDLGPPTRSKLPIVLLVIAALLGGFLIARATSSGDDAGDGGTDQAQGGGSGDEGGIPFPSGDVNRTGYWGFANLEPIVIDTFDRPDDPTSLGDAGTGQPWEAITGTWGVREDRAVTSGGSRDVPNIAVVPEGTGDGLTEVTMTVVEEGAGLVFRYLNRDNYWSVTANPGVGSWSLTRVIDGDTELVSEVPAPTNDGVTVSVTQDDSVIRVLIEGVEYLSITDAALGEQLQGGLIASPSTGGLARWDRFLTMRFREAAPAPTTTAAG